MSHRRVGPLVIALCFQSVVLFGQTASKTLLQTSSFNQQWLDVVVSIEVAEPQKPIRSIGTGFLVETPNKHVVVVTAKHVIQSPLSAGQRLGYRLNTSDSGSVIIWDDDLAKRGLGKWHQSATSDLACRFIAWPDAVKMVTLLPKVFIEDGVLTAGAPILVFGFPLGLRSPDQPRPIARHGIVGRADRGGMIADVFVFPGNSGGPVIYSPTLKVGDGLKSSLLNEEKLVGVVSSFISYREEAISTQTGRVRVVFEENSGLTNVVPVAQLVELISSDAVKNIDGSFK